MRPATSWPDGPDERAPTAPGFAGAPDSLEPLLSDGIRADPPTADASLRGSPEGRFLVGPGKAGQRQVADLHEQLAAALATSADTSAAAHRAAGRHKDQLAEHRGGDRPWPLRWFIPVAVGAEAATAYVAVEALVSSTPIADALSALVAFIGTGLACILANRRLNRLPVPRAARILEHGLVAVLTVLRYESMRIQGASLPTSLGAAALAGLISWLALLGIEEIVFETRTFALFLSAVRASRARARSHAAAARLAMIRARLATTAHRLGQHFLEFLLKSEGIPVSEARRRAEQLATALGTGSREA